MKARVVAFFASAIGFLAPAFADPAAPVDRDARWERWRLEAGSPRERNAAAGSSALATALRSGRAGGGEQLILPAAGRVDLTAPGAITLGVAPEHWVRGSGGEYVAFVAVNGRDGSTFLVERDRPEEGRGERLLVGFFELRGRIDYALELPLDASWVSLRRHTLAVSWDSTGFAASIDGAPFVRKAVPFELIVAAFEPSASTLVIGSGGAETTWIDSLRVFRRSLE